MLVEKSSRLDPTDLEFIPRVSSRWIRTCTSHSLCVSLISDSITYLCRCWYWCSLRRTPSCGEIRLLLLVLWEIKGAGGGQRPEGRMPFVNGVHIRLTYTIWSLTIDFCSCLLGGGGSVCTSDKAVLWWHWGIFFKHPYMHEIKGLFMPKLSCRFEYVCVYICICRYVFGRLTYCLPDWHYKPFQKTWICEMMAC